MATIPATGLLAQWEAARRVAVVPMSGIQFVAFDQTPAIGTRGLGSCSVVAVVSTRGAILAHIPPLPSLQSTDPYAGDNNARSMMQRVKDCYDDHKSRGYFPEADTYVVCAWYQGAVALPDQRAIMQQALRESIGREPATHTYDVPGDRSIPGQGTMIVLWNTNQGRPVVYLEDRAV